MTCGERLLAHLDGAATVTLVAPFVKCSALERVLNRIRPAAFVQCVTRWHADEVARGVSDLEVLDMLGARGNSELLLVSNLHAKMYRGDEEWLVGSANLTLRGLGWCPGANLEILTAPSAGDGYADACLQQALAVAVPADSVRQADVRAAAAAISQELREWPAPGSWAGEWDRAQPGWAPMCTQPGVLVDVYRSSEDVTRDLSSVVLDDATADLLSIAPPAGLDDEAFTQVIRSALSQSQIVQVFTDCIPHDRSARAQDVVNALASEVSSDAPYADAEEAYAIVKAWLMAFFPDRYVFQGGDLGDEISRGEMLQGWVSLGKW